MASPLTYRVCMRENYKEKKICSMHDTAVFHLNIYTYRILCERLLLSSPPLLLHYRLPSQLLPTRYVCLRFVPQASARRFSASPLTQSYLPNKRRVTRQDDAFYVLCAGRKCAIFTFYTPSSHRHYCNQPPLGH